MSLADRLAKAQQRDRIAEIRNRVQERLVEVLGPRLYDATLSDTELEGLVHQRLRELLDEQEPGLSAQEKLLIVRQIGDSVLSSFLPDDERIITIEDAAELRLQQPHVVRLEYRPPNIEGKGEVTIRDLVRNALRMRPDRIVVGEVRGGEALDMLQAMNTGHDGSLTTVHANSPRDVLSRLETMVLMAGVDIPMRAIREQIASAINLIVHQARLRDGTPPAHPRDRGR